MAVEIDLETRIYLILSDEKGHRHGDLVRFFGNECPKKYNKGTISNKLNSMEMKGYIKKDERLMPDRKQNSTNSI